MRFPILTSLIVLPIVGAIALLLVRHDEDGARSRLISLAVSVLVFAETLLLWARFDPLSADFQFVERYAWFGLPAVGDSAAFGLYRDGDSPTEAGKAYRAAGWRPFGKRDGAGRSRPGRR